MIDVTAKKLPCLEVSTPRQKFSHVVYEAGSRSNPADTHDLERSINSVKMWILVLSPEAYLS